MTSSSGRSPVPPDDPVVLRFQALRHVAAWAALEVDADQVRERRLSSRRRRIS